MDKFIKSVLLLSSLSLVGCVTQNYGNDGSQPIVQNESSQDELAMTRITLGLQYLKTGKTSQAKLNLEKAKYYAPNLVQVHTAFAHFYDSVGEPEQAIASYEKALLINESDADTRNNYGVFLCKQNRYEEAEKQFLGAIAIPSYILVAKSYENLALCQLKAKKFEKANTYLEKALDHAPANSSILLEMMRLQYVKANYISARNYLTRFEKATRRIKPNALALAIKIYQKQHNSKAAKNYANMLLKMFPNSFEAKQYLLNELAEIEEDRLAQEYAAKFEIPKKKKRVVVLKPKQAIADVVQELKIKEVSEIVNAPVKESDLVAEEAVLNTINAKVSDDIKSEVKSEVSADEKQKIDLQKSSKNKEVIKSKNDAQATLSLPFHSVKKGESLFSISKRYNIQLRFLMRWNGLNSKSVIHIGDVIYLADPKKAAKLRG